MRNKDEASVQPVMVSENAHNSGTTWYRPILIKFCLHIHLTLSGHWYAKRHEALPSISLVGIGQLVKMLITL